MTRVAALIASLFAPLFAALEAQPAPSASRAPHGLVPLPVSVAMRPADSATVTAASWIVVDEGDPALRTIGEQLAALIGNREDERPPVVTPRDTAALRARRNAPAAAAPARPGTPPVTPPPPPGVMIRLTRADADPSLGAEGYALDVTTGAIIVRASAPAGVFHGVQTLRQLLPPDVEFTAAFARPWTVPGITVRDRPRYAWRGAMLDVARHFRTPAEVRRFIDLMVPYKLNRLHLHLSDDQGWRIEIPGWPELTRIGGRTQVGGGAGGFYTTAEYEALVAYAADRYITIVPEIDVPGHVHAALASYPSLNCDGAPRAPYTGTRVGFSALCFEREETDRFLADVVREISARTPGAWFHMGGDEVPGLADSAYAPFVARMQALVAAQGKTMIGWDEIATAGLETPAVIQLWRPVWSADRPAGGARYETFRAQVRQAADRGARFILSPADRFYLDMQYDSLTPIGLRWAGLVDERRAYDWSERETFASLPDSAILGVEAPLWSETIGTMSDLEYLAFPRLAAVAELGWTARDARDWTSFRARLAWHGARWVAQGVNYRRSPGIDWLEW